MVYRKPSRRRMMDITVSSLEWLNSQPKDEEPEDETDETEKTEQELELEEMAQTIREGDALMYGLMINNLTADGEPIADSIDELLEMDSRLMGELYQKCYIFQCGRMNTEAEMQATKDALKKKD